MAAPREYSGRGFILGGVTDETPDWLGSYNEGVQGAQQQTQNRLNIRESQQRMGQNAAEEARRQARFGWEQQDRQDQIDAAGMGAMPGDAPVGPSLGVMPAQELPAPQAPSPGLLGVPDATAPAAPGGNGAITQDQKVAMLPQWARLEQAEGLPPNYLETISMLESSGGVNTGNGQFTGIFQIGPQVAADFGVTPEQLKDPMVNAQIAAKLAGRNARQLREALGREPQPWEIYLAHQQGLGGALALLRNPTMSAVDALTQAYGGDRSKATQAVAQNGGNPQMTAGEFAQQWAKKFGGALPQPFTGGPGLKVDGASPEQIGGYTVDGTPDPNASPIGNAVTDFKATGNRERIYNRIRGALTPNVIGEVGSWFGTQSDYDKRQQQNGANAEALKWYETPSVREAITNNPAALEAASKDPIGFYQQNKDSLGAVDTATPASEKGDLPAGLNVDGTPAAPAPAPNAPAPAGNVGVQEPKPYVPPAPQGDVVPRITQEEAGLTQPGQGSIAQQIMRTPAGQQTVLPDSGLYMVEPAKIQADKTELQQVEQLVRQQYARAQKLRDFQTMSALEGKMAEIKAAQRLMANMEAIAAMQAGDDNALAQQLSRLSGGALRIQPITPNGTYNVFYNGKMIYQNVTKDAFLASLRSHFDAQYQAQVAEATKRAYAREDEVLKSNLKIGENLATREADMYKQINIDAAKQALTNQNPEYFIDVADDGTVTAVPKTGPNAGQPQMFKLQPVTKVDGSPLLGPDGQPKLKLVPVGGASTVPVQ